MPSKTRGMLNDYKPPKEFCGYARFRGNAMIHENYPNGTTRVWKHSWNFTRKLIYLRQRRICYQCHYEFEAKNMECHHLHHREEKGSDHPANLIMLCKDCHKATLRTKTEKMMIKEQITKKNKSYWNKLTDKIGRETEDSCEICGMTILYGKKCDHDIETRCRQLIKQLEAD